MRNLVVLPVIAFMLTFPAGVHAQEQSDQVFRLELPSPIYLSSGTPSTGGGDPSDSGGSSGGDTTPEDGDEGETTPIELGRSLVWDSAQCEAGFTGTMVRSHYVISWSDGTTTDEPWSAWDTSSCVAVLKPKVTVAAVRFVAQNATFSITPTKSNIRGTATYELVYRNSATQTRALPQYTSFNTSTGVYSGTYYRAYFSSTDYFTEEDEYPRFEIRVKDTYVEDGVTYNEWSDWTPFQVIRKDNTFSANLEQLLLDVGFAKYWFRTLSPTSAAPTRDGVKIFITSNRITKVEITKFTANERANCRIISNWLAAASSWDRNGINNVKGNVGGTGMTRPVGDEYICNSGSNIIFAP